MPKPFYHTVFIILFCCTSCTSSNQINNPDWDELQLPAGWSIKAPKGFKVKRHQGIDSHPGVICNKEDSIVAYFDSDGYGGTTEENLSKLVQQDRKKIEEEWFKNLYKIPEYNTAYLDTVDGTIAIIVKPQHKGVNILDISITNQKTGAWLNISRGFWGNQDVLVQDEELLLQMFKTIRFKKESL